MISGVYTIGVAKNHTWVKICQRYPRSRKYTLAAARPSARPVANNVNKNICNRTTGNHGKKMLPAISKAIVSKPISIPNCTMPCNELANTNTSRGKDTFFTKAALANMLCMPVFVTNMKKFQGNKPHNKYRAKTLIPLSIPTGAAA